VRPVVAAVICALKFQICCFNTLSTLAGLPGGRERDEVLVVGAPQVLDTVGQQQDPLGLERVDRTLVVGDEDDRALVGRRAPRISAREAGSRLLVGSSSSRTLAADTTSIASDSRVFSPPESTRPACRRRRR
jgi:hypothetical protein